MKLITFWSKQDAEKLVNKWTNVIAIRGCHDSPAKYKEKPNKLLEVVVEDAVSQELIQHGRVFDETDARRVSEFLNTISQDNLDLVVHCQAGFSRSAAVVKALLQHTPSKWFWVDCAPCLGHFQFANQRIFEILSKELAQN